MSPAALAARVRTALRWRSPAAHRARRWTQDSLRAVRRDLPTTGMGLRCTDFPTDLPDWSRPVVEHSLALAGATCLQRCLVVQAWFTARDVDAEIVVAVPRASEDTFTAHAWLRGHDRDEFERYSELTVLRPPARPR